MLQLSGIILLIIFREIFSTKPQLAVVKFYQENKVRAAAVKNAYIYSQNEKQRAAGKLLSNNHNLWH